MITSMMIEVNRKSQKILPEESEVHPGRFWPYSGRTTFRVLSALIGVSILIFGIQIFFVRGNLSSVSSYAPEDVVYGQPVRADYPPMSGGARSKMNPLAFSGAPPRIKMSELFYDFGLVSSTSLLARTFVISNLGQSPLMIINPISTCGCTVATFTTSEIPPGKVALMTIQFDADFHEMRGTTVRRGVTFKTNDPDHPLMEIWIQAAVK
jgi:hypothetical protein